MASNTPLDLSHCSYEDTIHTNSEHLPHSFDYDDCPICLARFSSDDAIYETDCGHCFCAECITRHLNTAAAQASSSSPSSSECPLCRAQIRNVTLRKKAGEPLSQATPPNRRTPTQTNTTSTIGASSSNHPPTSTSLSQAGSSTSRTAQPMMKRRASKDIVLVKAKFNRQTYDVPLRCDIDSSSLRRSIGRLLSLDPSQMKIIHRGKLIQRDTEQHLKEILQYESQPTFQVIASKHVETQGKWKEEANTRCNVQ